MRLIEDALEKEGWSLHRTFQKDKDTMVYETKKLSDLPTIEVRKTGHWMREKKHYKSYFPEQEFYYYEERCSICGVTRRIGWRYVNYCPNCGADMRGVILNDIS